MARPKRCRRICTEPDFDAFAPAGIPCAETVTLTLEEYETIRLIDLENCTHQQCAQQMDISRTTVTELYEKARYKIADSLIGGKRLEITAFAMALLRSAVTKDAGKTLLITAAAIPCWLCNRKEKAQCVLQ